MSSYRPRTCTALLKPKHFERAGFIAKLSPTGLSFDALYHGADRQDYIDLSDSPELSRMKDEIVGRATTRCVANPSGYEPSTLQAAMRALQPKDEAINVGHEMRSSFSDAWELSRDEWGIAEGQQVVMVAFFEEQPVGFSTLAIHVNRDYDSKSLNLRSYAHMVYVAMPYRGMGFGIDIAMASAHLLRDVAGACYAAGPKGWTIGADVHAEYASDGGVNFVNHLTSELECEFEMLDQPGGRMQVGAVRLDAGF